MPDLTAASTNVRHRWKPIEDLSPELRAYRDRELQSLHQVWTAQRSVLDQEKALAEFNKRLAREWAIETGIIEGIYTLDRGVTRTLIEHGIVASRIPQGTTNLDPELVARIIQGHADVLEGLFAFIKSERPFGTSYIRELHAALLKYQETTTAFDQFGTLVLMQLQKGAYKTLPNNPTREDGSIHEYCPPEHVVAEMDRLVDLHLEHERDNVLPETEAAWLHHAFAQVHPFQDGNGRVARAIATVVLIKAGLFPYVVTLDDRPKYISALEAADAGELREFINFSSTIQKRLLTKAIGLAIDSRPVHTTDEAITSTRDLLVHLGRIVPPAWLDAKAAAVRFALVAGELFEAAARRLGDEIGRVDEQYRFRPETFGNLPSPPKELLEVASQLKYEPDFSQFQHTQRLFLQANGRSSEIVVSFHGVAPAFRGIVVCAAYFIPSAGSPVPLSDDIFRISYEEPVVELERRFRTWLDSCIANGITLWRRTLI